MKSYIKDKNTLSFVTSFLLLVAALILNYYASVYATENVSNSVTDIILSNIKTYDVDGLFIYGGFSIFFIIVAVGFLHVKKIPFIVKSIALFVFVRSIFITLTHLGPFPTMAPVLAGSIAGKFFFAGDLFFSGHTGLPFLMCLMFWNNKILRYLFLGLSIFFGCIVLLGHYHYSIDVLSAYFITYTIYSISKFLFKKDFEIFNR